MEQENIKLIADILGEKQENIAAFPKEITDGMQAVIDTYDIQDEEDMKELYKALEEKWEKGKVISGLKEISEHTSISYELLRSLKYEHQKTIVFTYFADSFDLVTIYELVNEAVTLADIDKVGKFIGLSAAEIDNLPMDKKVKMCGMYDMEFEPDTDNSELKKTLKEVAYGE